MSPEFWAAANTYGVVFGVGVLVGALLDRLAHRLVNARRNP
jgi:hypothetical protein